ncbi:hypothetical protein M885DRAFT_523930 [Pelagophyceae sp. CCMP2097]|nr:hypothetical protein M885DRAFT_523930 [Pelagophyceae sp. CCMP2097]
MLFLAGLCAASLVLGATGEPKLRASSKGAKTRPNLNERFEVDDAVKQWFAPTAAAKPSDAAADDETDNAGGSTDDGGAADGSLFFRAHSVKQWFAPVMAASSFDAAADAADAAAGPTDDGAAADGSLFFRARRLFTVEGSRCIQNGGGRVPFFNSCVGCPIAAARQCVADMRTNVSFNVAPDCTLGGMTEGADDKRCCAIRGKAATYAYPDAIRCLRGLYCDGDVIYTQLLAECELNCPKADDDVWDAACSASSIDAAKPKAAAATALGVVLFVFLS